MDVTLTEAFISEVVGTGLLLLLGAGVVANAILPRTKGFNGGWLLINFGWGLAVFAGVFAAWKSGAHLNPAVTFGLLANGAEYYDGGEQIEVTAMSTLVYIVAQLIGAFLGAVLAWAAYKQHFDEVADPGVKLGVFSTGPAIRSYGWNFATEVLGTFVLVFVVIQMGNTPTELGPLAVALLVVGIGASLGGPTGYAINPARDLGPRIAHALLPIPGKGSSDWGYSWVPIAGPLVGGVLAGLLARVVA
ncbi:MAG: aquaporin family protein [Actinotalea sp.]|nr:aquaporin family protein [Actinotalea sp.]